MKKSSLTRLFAGLLAVALLGGSVGHAADAKAKPADATKEATAAPKAKQDWYPFSGTVAAVDQKAKTISLKKKEGVRVLKIDSKTQLDINGKPAILADVVVGTYAHGKLHKDASGAEIITSSKFDKEAPAKAKESSEAATPALKPKKQTN